MPDNIRFSIDPDTLQKPPGYSHVVEVTGPGRTVYFAGQLGIDKSGKMGANVREQVEIAFENVKAALASVGASFEHVVKLNSYVVDIGTNIAHYREVRDKYVNKAAPPASTTIGVPQLARPGALLRLRRSRYCRLSDFELAVAEVGNGATSGGVRQSQARDHHERARGQPGRGESAIPDELAEVPYRLDFLGAALYLACRHVVASACPAGGLRRAVPSHNRPAPTFRRAVAARNQARRLPGDRPQGRRAGEALQPAGQRSDLRFPLIVEALAKLRSRSCIIDGEAVACGDDGIALFERIRYRRLRQQRVHVRLRPHRAKR